MSEQKPLKAMVLAAGVGSRLDPLTRQIPKPLVPLANRPVMEHILRLLKRHGVKDVISNLHHLPETIPAYFGSGSALDLNLNFRNEVKLSGDAGGVRFCRDFLDSGTFLVIMGDLITDADISYVVEQHRNKGSLATIALQRVDDVRNFGVAVLGKDGFIKGFQEKPQPSEAISNLASTGIYVLEPEVFQHIPECGEFGFGRQLFPTLVAKGLPVLGVQIYGYWSDTGTMEFYRQTTKDALSGMVDLEIPGESFEDGWIGEGSYVADDCVIEGKVAIGRNVMIERGVRLTGSVVIGDNSRVFRGCSLTDSIVWSNSIIGTESKLVNSVVGRQVHTKPRTNLLNKAVIEPEVRNYRSVSIKAGTTLTATWRN